MRKSKRLVLIFSIIFSFISGIYSKNYISKIKNNLSNSYKDSLNKINLDSCPEEISYVPNKSVVIIGHAYGSHKKSNERGNIGIAPKVMEFYSKHKKNIDIMIFSGDILKEPSLKKWKNFYEGFDKELKIYIAPGNHDVHGKTFDSALRDVFNMTNHRNQNNKKFPFEIKYKDSVFIIVDSNSKENSINKINKLIQEKEIEKYIYVIMHHVLPEGLANEANAPGRHSFIKDLYFIDNIKYHKNKKITFIYGDGGAFEKLSRIKCIDLGNSKHIVNGIGEIPGDLILIINNKNIYRMTI